MHETILTLVGALAFGGCVGSITGDEPGGSSGTGAGAATAALERLPQPPRPAR